MSSKSAVKSMLIVAATLVAYAVLVSPPDPIAMGMLLFLTAPPAWGCLALGRAVGARIQGPPPAQGAALAAGFGLLWGAPMVAQAQLARQLDAGGEVQVSGFVMALPILGPLLWSAAVGWVGAVREVAGQD